MSRAARLGRVAMAGMVLLCGLTLALGYANKHRCAGPEFNESGRSEPDYDIRRYRDVCYSDIQQLWLGRDVDNHVFPYLSGRITTDGELLGGAVEYPVLSGLLIWAGATFAGTDADFLFGSALILVPFGLLTAWLLGRLSRWRALLWALGPPLVLYAFHNWDLPAVACAVGAVYVLHRGWGRQGAGLPLLDRATMAAVLLGIGFAFKLYPGIFVLPLALYVLTANRAPDGPGRYDLRGALRVVLAAAVPVVLANLPFVVLGYEGWRASITFQQQRKVDISTNSIWYWAFRPRSDPEHEAFQTAVNLLSPVLVLLSFAAAAGIGWWRWRRDGVYPWLGVSAAMLCGFLLLHKVHSPQYVLWLLPFFVLLRARPVLVVLYLAADVAMGIGIFRWFHLINNGLPSAIDQDLAAQLVTVGVWGRATLLALLFWAFLTARPTVEDEPAGDLDRVRPGSAGVAEPAATTPGRADPLDQPLRPRGAAEG